MVIIFAPPGDLLAEDVGAHVERHGTASLVIPPPGPGSPLKLSWDLARHEGVVEYRGVRREMAEITGVVVRALPRAVPQGRGRQNWDYLSCEWSAALLGWLQAVPATVVNRPRPGQNFSPPQLHAHLAAFASAGFCLAPILVTDSRKEAERFLKKSGKAVVLLPGTAPSPGYVKDAAELPSGVCSLIAVPEGVTHCIQVVAAEVFAGEVAGDGTTVSVKPIGGELASRCRLLANRLGLHFLELAIVLGKGGEVVIGARDLPEAVFSAPYHRELVAASLAKAVTDRMRGT